MSRRLAVAMFVSVLGTLSALPAAQQPPGVARRDAAIRLRAGTFNPARGEQPPEPADARPGQAGDVQSREYLVQFEGPVQDVWKAAVSGAGATLLEYIPDFAFRARMDPSQAQAVRQLAFVNWVGPYHAAYKLAGVGADRSELPMLVRLDRDAATDAVEAAIASMGVPVSRAGRSLLLVRVRVDGLPALARLAGVASVEPYQLRVKHNEFGGGVVLGSQLANANGYDGSSQVLAVADTGLGTGTAAGAHADLPASRVRAIFNRPGVPDACFDVIADDGAADVDSGHGTHVATAALGSGNALGVGRGTAPGAALVFQAIENYAIPSLYCSLLYGVAEGYYLVGIPADLGDLYAQAYDEDARVHSDSWGSAANGAYTADAENTDAFVWAHRDMTLLFSAGNQGVDADGNGQVDAGSIGSPATAKNVLAVGASENDRRANWPCDTSLSYTACAAQGGQNTIPTYGASWPGSYPANPLRDDPSAGNAEQMAAFSSRGPTTDGRIKPDVVAPGTWTLSGYGDLYQQQYDQAPNPQNGQYQYDGWGIPADPSYKYMGGTSMAAPLAAGGAAVVRDFYQKAHGHQATAALVKATLINSAVDLLDENNDGALDNAFPIPNIHEGWGRVDLANATDNTQQFSDEAAPLTTGATATYTFPVSDAGRPFKATLVWTDYPASPSAAVSLVNDLDLTLVAPDGTTYMGNVFAGGWSAVGGAHDRLNNVENAFVPSAAAGTWTVIVTGYNVPLGPQRFALVVDNGPVGNGLPVVRLSVDDATGTEAGPTNGAMRVMRTGDTAAPLTVYYTVAGTATPDSDYRALPGFVVVPAGSADAVIAVETLDDLLVEPGETVAITLASDDAYTVGSPASGTLAITSDDLPPDLVLTSVTAPTQAGAGTSIAVTDTTRNQGTAGALSSETGFYLSANATLDGSDVFLGSRTVSALQAGGSQSGTTSLLVPESTATGNYYIVAKADWSGQLEETNDANNVRASGIVRVGPDLVVSTVSVPATAAPGGVVTVSDTTRNQGAGAADASVTIAYLSQNTTLDAGDPAVGQRAVLLLAGGASSTGSMSVTIPPSTTAGTYYLLFKADADGTVAESTETNNVRSGTVRVGADLTVTALTGPASAGSGDTINVAETTKNSGGAETPESTTAFYLSSNASFDAGDTALGSRPVPALAAGASSAATVPLVLPAGTEPGTYYVLARADDPGVVAETSESNNVRASGVIRVGPDLTVVSLTAPSTADAGGTVSVTDTVRNQGGASSPGTETAFYLSTNASFDASDIELGRRVVPVLGPSASSAAIVSLALPASLSTGSYYVLSVVDPDSGVAEAAENNNMRASGVLRVGPDLTVTSLTGPASVVRGTAIALTDTTRNQGGGAAPVSTTRFYLSANASLDASDVLLGERGVPALAGGASNQATTSLAIPAGTAPGSYYVIVRADDPEAIGETAENNNVRTRVVRVDP